VKPLRKLLDWVGKPFEKGGKLEKLGPLYEAVDNFLYTPGVVTAGPPHVRDFMDLKRFMSCVVIALIPPLLVGLYNTGYQVNLGLEQLYESMKAAAGAGGKAVPATLEELRKTAVPGWRNAVLTALGIGVDSGNLLGNFLIGLLYFLPIYIVTLMAGGFWEVVFAVVRRHQISEGFLVTSLLFPMILPPTIPLWQVALGISFGIVLGKEVFGGVGMNILNPALTGRVFLYFAYPGQISGDAVWVAVDGFSRATPLGVLSDPALQLTTSFNDAFLGFIPGSIGETSALACIIGAGILIVFQIGSWRVMLGSLLGMVSLATLFNIIGSDSNPMFGLPAWWHLALGGFAFGTVYMATDPVTAAHTEGGHYVYGALIGVMTVLVRVVNPGFPEGIMLAILFANVFAPTIDKIFVSRNIKRRQVRNAGCQRT